eukprot:TRINITY_DN48383_c0_g1_i1.p1 TRINITY_DN48383_c0_g1~~TRINITY_DN48383_c0_g1_i1.p1  ORF type:complete len:129 (-),score=16.99 TRINITY_DN48383_c0_g1_i1:23-409(-)
MISAGDADPRVALAGQTRSGGQSLDRDHFAENVSRLADLKTVVKISGFNGEESKWAEFKFKVENLLLMLGIEELMAEAEATEMDGDLISDSMVARSKFVYSLLVDLLTAKALAIMIVRLCGRGDGLTV